VKVLVDDWGWDCPQRCGKLIEKYCNINKDSAILDSGCGIGLLSK
jgi:predicted TPR repeat methyltransferase